MDTPFPGLGTLVNTVAVVAGALLGMAAGHRLPEPTKRIVTDCLGLVALLMAGLSVMAVTDPALSAAVGSSAPVLIVLGSLLLGGIITDGPGWRWNFFVGLPLAVAAIIAPCTAASRSLSTCAGPMPSR